MEIKSSGGFNYHDLYISVANSFLSGVFVEVGCWEGESIVFMAKNIKGKDIQLYGVDRWEPYVEPFNGVDVHWNPDYELYLKNVKPYNIITIKKDSKEASKDFEDNSIDFCFLDAGHSYEAVKGDIEAWRPKVRGILAGHDYTWQFPGVVRAVDEAFKHKVIQGVVWIAISE